MLNFFLSGCVCPLCMHTNLFIFGGSELDKVLYLRKSADRKCGICRKIARGSAQQYKGSYRRRPNLAVAQYDVWFSSRRQGGVVSAASRGTVGTASAAFICRKICKFFLSFFLLFFIEFTFVL